jgi:hypothetical protein
MDSGDPIGTRLGEYEILDESGNHRFTRAIAAAGRFHSGPLSGGSLGFRVVRP